MRAYHMPSLPEMPLEHLHGHPTDLADVKQMKLKILYALDNNTNFLARSTKMINVKTARIPIPGQNNIMTLGVVSIREVLEPVLKSSPELFSDLSWDYSIYAKDVSEEDEPFVGHGLVSKLLNPGYDYDEEVMITGRVCSSFTAFSNKGPLETLEVRLKLVKVRNQQHQQQTQQQQQESQQLQQTRQLQLQPKNIPAQSLQASQMQQEQQQQQEQQSQYQRRHPSTSTASNPNRLPIKPLEVAKNKRKLETSSTDTEDEEEPSHTFVEPKFVNISNPNVSNLPKMNRFVNNNPAPKAVRTQSLPVFENMMKPPPQTEFNAIPLHNFPAQSIARRIYMADRMNEKFSNPNNQLNETGSSPAEAQLDVSKRFAPDFMKGSTNQNASSTKKTDPKRKTRKVSSNAGTSSSNTNKKLPKKVNDIPEEHQVYQSCFNCKTLDAKGWKWNECDDLSKRGLLCSNCYNYLKEKGVMRPRRLFNKTAASVPSYSTTNSRSTKDKIQHLAKQVSSSPSSSFVGSDSIAPLSNGNGTSHINNRSNNNGNSIKLDNNLPSSVYEDSSDPLNGYDEMVNSDFDFAFGPLTDIDPLPPHQQQQIIIEDKENIPPVAISMLKKATRQSSFEKMLVKSFSGALPTTTGNGSPSEWMVDLFPSGNVEPTPKDATPKDSPKDITTCNTLPCNEESPESDSNSKSSDINTVQQSSSTTPSALSKSKVGPVPSSPFLSMSDQQAIDRTIQGEDDASSPNSMNNQSYWGMISDSTRLSSQHDEVPSKIPTQSPSHGQNQTLVNDVFNNS